MDKITVKAYAKINIGLDVTGKTDNGYHLLKTVMQQVDLYDDVTVEKCDEGIKFECGSSEVPLDDTNLAVKAARLMIDTYNIKEGVKIVLKKNIPVAAGMAGGSTDGAAAITGINEVFNLGLTLQDMMDIGVKIGADVPFCIHGGCALAEGIGEKLTVLDNKADINVLIVKPPINVSTAFVYKNLNLPALKHPDMESVITGIKTGDIKLISENMGNVLESVTSSEYEIIGELKNAILEAGADGSLMSGSGPTVFGIFSDKEKCLAAENILKEKYPDSFVKATGIIR